MQELSGFVWTAAIELTNFCIIFICGTYRSHTCLLISNKIYGNQKWQKKTINVQWALSNVHGTGFVFYSSLLHFKCGKNIKKKSFLPTSTGNVSTSIRMRRKYYMDGWIVEHFITFPLVAFWVQVQLNDVRFSHCNSSTSTLKGEFGLTSAKSSPELWQKTKLNRSSIHTDNILDLYTFFLLFLSLFIRLWMRWFQLLLLFSCVRICIAVSTCSEDKTL